MPALARKLQEPPRKATYQDVLDAPENMVAQLIDGELYLHARPAIPHVWASGKLYYEIEHRYGRNIGGDSNGESDGDGPGEWAIMIEPELRLSKDVLVPDIAGWRVDRLLRKQTRSFSHIVPDWVCEVLSPSTREFDLGRKSNIYAREGVSHLWIVDAEARTLQASALSTGKWLLISTLSDTEMVSVPPFEKLNIPLSRLLVGGPLWPYSG